MDRFTIVTHLPEYHISNISFQRPVALCLESPDCGAHGAHGVWCDCGVGRRQAQSVVHPEVHPRVVLHRKGGRQPQPDRF